MATITDMEMEYLALLGRTGTINDRRAAEYGSAGAFAYWAGESGLTPAFNYSLNDHMLKVFRNETGLLDGTLSDTKALFFFNEITP